jgi:hypothetical protein
MTTGYKHDAEQLSDALSDIDEKLLKLRQLVEAASENVEKLTCDMQAMTHKERFDAAMGLWSHLTKIGTAASWIDIHKGAARRHANYLLEAFSEEDA